MSAMPALSAHVSASRPLLAPPLKLVAAAAIALLLVLGVVGGLQRAGALPWAAATTPAALAHGALMIGGWLGSVIALERAVALKTVWARLAPLLAAAGGLALAAGLAGAAGALLTVGSAAFVVAHAQLWRRQRALPNALLGLAALCWLCGNGLWWAHSGSGGATADAVIAAWFAFLVLTIAAERLEMTRLLRRPPGAERQFVAIAATLCLAVVAAALQPTAGRAGFGAALLLLAAWLARHDIARITVRQRGLPRYMAVALWCGYAWLAVGALAWLALAFGAAQRDAALHAIGLGFVLSMVMAHAPVILPAVTGVRLAFGPAFYAPLALLQLSLALRLAVDRTLGAQLNAAALVLFAATVLAAIANARTRRS